MYIRPHIKRSILEAYDAMVPTVVCIWIWKWRFPPQCSHFMWLLAFGPFHTLFSFTQLAMHRIKSNSRDNGMRWRVGFWWGRQRLGLARRRSRRLQRGRSGGDPWRTSSSSYCCWVDQERHCNRWTHLW